MSQPNNEALKEVLAEYLTEHHVTPPDLLKDAQGWYFFEEIENGNPGDDYEIEQVKHYLPEQFQGLL